MVAMAASACLEKYDLAQSWHQRNQDGAATAAKTLSLRDERKSTWSESHQFIPCQIIILVSMFLFDCHSNFYCL